MTKYETVKKLNLIDILEEKNVTPKCCYPDKQRLLQARRKSSWRTSAAAWQARLQFCVSGLESCFLQVGLASKHQVLVGEFQSHNIRPLFRDGFRPRCMLYRMHETNTTVSARSGVKHMEVWNTRKRLTRMPKAFSSPPSGSPG